VHHEIAATRLHNQYIARGLRAEPADLVARLGAVQAQEYPFATWGLALRLARERSAAEIGEAFDAGRILRTHVLRPTWLLGGGISLTRAELGSHLARARIRVSSMQLGFITMYAELDAVVCSGPRRGRQFTYALVSDRAPHARRLPRDEALAELTRRYFTSHAPATIRDFVWWSGLTVADTKRGLEMTGAKRRNAGGLDYWRIGGTGAPPPSPGGVHLLPIYDEFLVAYRDRVAVPHGPGAVGPAGVTFRHALIIGGQVAGTWNVRSSRGGCAIQVTPMRRLSRPEQAGVQAAADRFGRFIGAGAALTFA
jgi:hypothetical protein